MPRQPNDPELHSLLKAIEAVRSTKGREQVRALRAAVSELIGMSGLPRSEVREAVEDWA